MLGKFWNLSRRRFLAAWSAVGLAGRTELIGSTTAQLVVAPSPGYRVLSAPEVRTLEAIVEQIIPQDQDPGSRWAGVVRYIDGVLATDQREKQSLYRDGLGATNASSRAKFGRDFVDLEFDRQNEVLQAIERGDVALSESTRIASREFFALVWRHTIEGFYGAPTHGGNRDYVGWRMIGFPHQH